uniref:Uncharacterized protein n=1 Tax=Chromera velia CCMP2878 TaxID=1169474 RepID=A0A0G4HQB1_9ALVE|eukprot:Cvel_30179.t1-p1 / transcript=Cvel_30179.t1 / gene=Cvel_30179 / organism=Chromera_velia_CCMP2878 / gene_product=hypothetical protein / transcript_product=hypothetical protein / location=Cvel_scaffold4265:6837-8004(+) / protein_length=78 / sequence_SO=supercontig / SO=protein_coding / is_pseudo=false
MMATMTKKALSNQKHDGREGFFSVTRILSFVFPSASKIAEEAEADKLRLLSKKTLKECAEAYLRRAGLKASVAAAARR